ncbi:hypothetical protein KJE20_02182 [Pyrenophora tritici-repentis]|uniref:Uncharacterized protein n=1 Tax=Pyrenophora tritici-repentis TaxID=45151 RepID=A0A922NLE5_9PLEO|nr:hypothetical protein Ptr86124_003478 [Pyrenophora tritici-repentis]KAI1689004.1 hypothetical protein KJE20_02182 [Pyrenophora tritici-repentis]
MGGELKTTNYITATSRTPSFTPGTQRIWSNFYE